MSSHRLPGSADADAALLAQGLDSDISMVHRRFLAAMECRLPAMTLDMKERYFSVLSKLVSKLEVHEKPLREVLREMMAESAHLVLRELTPS